MITYIGTTFPNSWLWSSYENNIIKSIKDQIEKRYSHQNNLFINLTWFGPQFDNEQWKTYLELKTNHYDNLFLLATVDPPMIPPPIIEQMLKELQGPKLFKIGNFDTQYHFNFFAPILVDHFKKYQDEEILLDEPVYTYINYNRKPREHRVKFMNLLIKNGLDKFGINTLGRPDVIFDKDPANNLYLSIGEKSQDYVSSGHWYTDQEDKFDIPHDVLSLHRMDLWRQHFLYIIGATEFNHWDDIFVSETQFKPIIGLRPFLINGNARTYQWLRDNGFKTFDQWFPGIDFDDCEKTHENLILAIKQIICKTPQELKAIYKQMWPTLKHNQQRFWEYADEQRRKIDSILLL